uniref:H15 domain-containing protein n=1 Tax=Ciona savignyi TaxID=51511 RepID=H2YWB6_CIOSA
MTKKPRKGTNKQNAKKSGKGKKKGKVITKKVTRKTQATQKKRPSPTGVKTKQTRKPKKATKKKSLQIAPMPRAEHSRGKERRRKRKQKSAKKNKDGETRSSTSEKFPFSPVPSARIPTFIAMVKTAIRDLKPFRITGRDAIARYIQIRYRVRNDDLLKYVLKWLVDMGVLTVKDKNYLFVGKRLVTKKTVAIVRKSKKTALQQLLRKRKMKKLKKKKHKRSSKKLKERSRRSKKMKHRKGKRSKRSKRCKSKKCSKKRKKCRNAKCTCSKELKSRKNRIKWKTRYIRKNGKIYKQDEYV